MKINSVRLVTMCQMESKKKKKKQQQQKLFLFSFPLSDNINRKIYQSIQKPAALLSRFNCCGLSANLYIHWLKTQAIVYELLYFDVFEGADKRVWQLLKDFKYDKVFHYVTIKSKTLICHFNQNTSVRSSIHPSIHTSFHPSIHASNDQNAYEMTKKGTKWLGYELTTI